MNYFLQRLKDSFIPFIMLGIATALIIGFFIMFSYVLLWGIVIGIVLWIAASVKDYFFPNTNHQSLHGRIIDYKNNSNSSDRHSD